MLFDGDTAADWDYKIRPFHQPATKFHQPTPRMQLTAIRSAIEGHLSNLEDGIITSVACVEKLKPLLQDLKELEPHLEASKWI